MGVLNDNTRLGASAAGAYEIGRSLRFNGADSTSLSFTPSSAGNLKRWTVSLWTKRTKLGAFQPIWGTGTAATGSTWGGFYWDASDKLYFFDAAFFAVIDAFGLSKVDNARLSELLRILSIFSISGDIFTSAGIKPNLLKVCVVNFG